jgi:hypothetical protein
MGSDQDASRQTQCKVDVMRTPQHEQLFIMFWRPIANGHGFVCAEDPCGSGLAREGGVSGSINVD